MKRRLRERADDQENEDLEAEQEALDEAARERPVAYRVAGNVEVQRADLEQKLNDMTREMRALEREVYAARKTLRRSAAVRSTSIGGLGALVGVILGAIAYATLGAPWMLILGTVLGFFFGFIGSAPWKPPDDRFPDAPPPRMY